MTKITQSSMNFNSEWCCPNCKSTDLAHSIHNGGYECTNCNWEEATDENIYSWFARMQFQGGTELVIKPPRRH